MPAPGVSPGPCEPHFQQRALVDGRGDVDVLGRVGEGHVEAAGVPHLPHEHFKLREGRAAYKQGGARMEVGGGVN